MPQSGAGEGADTVLLGCLVKEHLRLWRSDGRAECVRVLHPSALRGLLARDIAPRVRLEMDRFREIGQLESAGVLRVGRRHFAVEICEEPPTTEAFWDAASDVFQDAAVAAIARGEYLVVALGGWGPESEPYAVAGAKKTRGEWLLRVEAVPAPHAPSWPEPPEDGTGFGVAARADAEALSNIGMLLGEAAATWAASPLDVVLTFGKQPDGPWPPADTPEVIERMLGEMRADIAELHTTRQMQRARDLSTRTSVHFNHNAYPVFFTGDLRSALVLAHPNPRESVADTDHYEGNFEYGGFDDYVDRHREFGRYRWEQGGEQPSVFDQKQLRFARPWGVIDIGEDDADTDPGHQPRNRLAHAFDQMLQLELIPFGSPNLPAERLTRETIAQHYQRLMRAITAYPRKYVVLCGAAFDTLLAPYVADRDDHRFRLPTSKGMSRVEYRFSNVALDFDGGTVPVGFAPSFTSLGIPMEAYGRMCHELYRDIRR